LRSWARISKPLPSGKHDVEQHQIRAALLAQVARQRFAQSNAAYLVTRHRQPQLAERDLVGIVLDQQDDRSAPRSSRAAAGWRCDRREKTALRSSVAPPTTVALARRLRSSSVSGAIRGRARR
jgi:hypothetical protein